MADPNEQTHINTTEARAGSTPGMTRYILAASLLLIVILFGVLFGTGAFG